MSLPAPNLEQIKVQTARMMEIYGLLQGELSKSDAIALTDDDRTRLHRAVAIIEANMRQLLAYFAEYKEENSTAAEESRELEEILEAVLKWQIAIEKGEQAL